MISELDRDHGDAVLKQRAYYAATAEQYDTLHGGEGDTSFAFVFLLSAVNHLGVTSVLDIGSGTGFALLKMKRERPDISAVGIEPSVELRKIGYAKGLSEDELVEGDATNLRYADGSFDLVCELGVLHHVPEPSKAVSEMLRVARKAVFIADCNNFGQGSRLSRLVKQTVRAIGLWPLADRIKTRGKGYTFSEGDGVSYSYSVFNDYEQIARKCNTVHLLNTTNAGPNLYRSAAGVALLGIKKWTSPDGCSEYPESGGE
jgi:ubiquinone/menaquinone biosynthesis C-methylase UbiE